MASRPLFAAMFGLLYLRTKTTIPLAAAWRRLLLAVSSGDKREERLADAAWRRGDGVGAVKHWEKLVQSQPRNADWPAHMAQVAKERGDLAGAERILLEARDRGLGGERIDLGLLRYGRLCRRSNAAIDDAETVIAAPAASAAKLFHSAFYLAANNRLEGARAGFTRALGDPNYGPLARGQLAAVDLLAQRRSQGFADVPGWVSAAQDSVLVREPSSDTLVVGFAGPEGALGLSMNALHAMLSSRGVNALYLYDSRQVYHLAGSGRFGPGYRAMIDGIRALARELGTRKLVTVGGSTTGYTAIRAAMDLNADGALAFSPLTIMPPWASPAVTRSAHIQARLKEEARAMMVSLRPLLRAHKAPLRVAIYYSAANRRDILHAGNLAGLPNVVLHPIRTHKRHDCLTEMAARGYRDLLAGVMAQ